MKIVTISLVVLLLLLIFWNALKRLKQRIELNNFIVQKKAITGLIKEIQNNYFKSKKISESEYRIKLKKFKELIRDIDRRVMLLKEEIFKMNVKSK